MHKDSTTTIWVNKVKIAFSKKKMTAYGGLSLMAAFFKQIRLREAIERAVPVREVSPNSTGIYGKIMMYFSMVYAEERDLPMYYPLRNVRGKEDARCGNIARFYHSHTIRQAGESEERL